jgi:hypothetical protein
MQNLKRRVGQLERRTIASQEEGLRLVLRRSEVELALDTDRCVEILREGGLVRTGPGISILDLSRVPNGLSAKELERRLRHHGEEICNGRPAK